MHALVCHELTGFQNLRYETIDAPALRPNSVRIRVRAAGLNFADTLITRGKYQVKVPTPFIPGMEAAGEIVEVADSVEGWAVGDRVAVLLDSGAYAEEIVVEAQRVVRIPKAMSFEEAAGFMVTYGTSHIGLRQRGNLQAGEVLLVHGASGGVGLTAVEIGKKIGATVIATASTDAKLAVAQEYGADHLICSRDDDVGAQVKALTDGHGADVVYDPVGGRLFDESLHCIAWEGRILHIGFASGTIPQVPANYLLVKNCASIGVYWGAYLQKDPAVLVRANQELMQWYAEGAIRPRISQTFALKDGVEAIQALVDRKTTGKVVLIP